MLLKKRWVELINSTRKRISSLKVFYVPFYRRSSTLQHIYFLYRIRWFDYACTNTRKSRASIREKIHHCQRAKTWWKWRIISIITELKPHAPHKTHLHTIKVYNTRPFSLTIEVSLKFARRHSSFFRPLKYSLVPKLASPSRFSLKCSFVPK